VRSDRRLVIKRSFLHAPPAGLCDKNMAKLRIVIIATQHASDYRRPALEPGDDERPRDKGRRFRSSHAGRCSRRCPEDIFPAQSVGKMMNHRPRNGDDEADQRRSAALIGLIIILALAIAGVWLVRELRQKSALEDCLMSGRTNCAPIETPSRR
jgi:hypothetical protein